MTEDEARRVELVRAIEQEDREATLLTREDRTQAEAHARSLPSPSGKRRAGDRYIARRAAFAAARLTTRHPGIAGLLHRSRWPGWLGLALPALALVAGFVANELGNGRRLDLLAVPLLGTIAWNLLVYLWILLTSLRPGQSRLADPLHRAIARIAGIGARDFENGSVLHRAANRFEERWSIASAPLVSARIARTLHWSAAFFAIGLIGGIYARALVIEYRAGWESTFLGPDAVHALLAFVLGPASWLSEVAIPSTDAISAMRWSGSGTGGVNAAPWIHLYTVTVAGLVIVPRAVLGGWAALRAWRLAQVFPVAGREDFYIRRLLRSAGGLPGTARVTPYAYRPGDETRRRLATALRAALGDGADVRFDPPVDYGSEDRWLSHNPGSPDDDYHIVLFTLSSTPEEENHGALATALRARIEQDHPGTVLCAIVDESPFRAHFAGQAGLDERVEGRLGTWRRALAGAAIAVIGLDLSHEADTDLAQRLESGLLPDGALHG